MKKIFYLASIAALAFSSCAKDNTTEAEFGTVVGGAKITAAVEADDTRTSLEKVDGKYEFRWSAGDQLGVYGVGGGLNNAAFVLNNDSDGKAVGVFASQSTELKTNKKYVAVYPRFQTSLFNTAISEVELPVLGTTSKAKIADLTGVTMSIPATQKYQPETFYTQTVPSVSTTFVVDENGAQVSMQPVVDYLFVNIKSTEPISKLYLELVKSNGSQKYNIAGKGKLARYELGNDYRYMLNVIDEDASDIIVLEMDESSDAVTCHDANTYVFTVPAGILGMNDDVQACIFVNEYKSSPDFYVANGNAQLNFFWDTKGTASTADDVKVSRRHATTAGKYISRLENTVFWANELKNGVRTSFEYNPNGDVIIEHEGQLLKYLTEYDAANGKDAFICSEHVFDFSLNHMRELTTELKANGTYNDYQVYISNYLADNGTFPCVEEYANEFKGNGATITGIVRPLASMNGIFGEITGKIDDVTFDGIVAKTTKTDNVVLAALGKIYVPGVILGSMDGGKLNDVVVENANGLAILYTGNVAAYNELTVAGVSNLYYIIGDMDVESDIEIKNWNVVKGVKSTVFSTIDATDGESDSHHVVKLPAGADYAKLAQYVSTASVNFVLNFEREISGWELYVGSLATPANDADNYVLSVLIGDESYWTGDKTNWSMALPKQVGGTGADKNYYKLEYAEQLAMGANSDNSARVMRNMHLESAVNPWKMVTVNTLDGNNKTISGVYMDGYGLDVVAPVNAETIKNLVVDGVTLDIATDMTHDVPATIAGLSASAKTVTNVTVKNLVIDAYAFDGTNNTEAYYGEAISNIGWLVAEGTDIYVTNSKVEGVESNVRGLAGLVAKITLTEGAQINNSAATNVTMAQTALTAFAQKKDAHKNVAGTAVCLVVNNQSNPKDIKFVGCGQPVFLYDSANGVTVVYGNTESKTYKNQ